MPCSNRTQFEGLSLRPPDGMEKTGCSSSLSCGKEKDFHLRLGVRAVLNRRRLLESHAHSSGAEGAESDLAGLLLALFRTF